MPTSPLIEKMDYISLDILVKGKRIPDTYDVLSVEVESAVNKIPTAVFSILLPLGESENKSFTLSEGKDFVPGNEIEIKAGYNSKTERIFKGIIVRHGIKAKAQGRVQLIIHCQDKAVQMTVGKQVKAYAKQSDSDIIGAVLGKHGMSKDVDKTTYKYAQLLQTGMSDWDFIITRAEANGLIVYLTDNKVHVKKPLSSGSADLKVSFDRDVFDFEAEVDAGYQLDSVKASGWDFVTEKFVDATSTEPTINKQGNQKGKTLAKVTGSQEATLQFTGPMESDELKGIANGLLLRSRLASIRGRVKFFGSAKPALNTLIELHGFGQRFNGDALITRVRHTIHEGNWRTETGFGLSPTFHHEKHVQATGGHGQLPSINGLQNAVVKKIHEDPDNQYRIEVTLPVLQTDIWARLGGMYATKGKGSFFLPEIGDEVIVGFLNDDPRYAIILGSVYSSRNKPAYEPDKENTFKALVSNQELKLEMNDKDKVITISTPQKNSIVLSDKDKAITIKDQNGNIITMDSNGITLKSAKEVKIDATSNISQKAAQAIDIKADGGDVTISGLNVNCDGKVAAKLKGGATAELSSGGQTSVKGAMVMIN